MLALAAAGCGSSGTSNASASATPAPTTTAPASSPDTTTPPAGLAPSATSAPPVTTAPPSATGAPASGSPQAASSRCTVTSLKMRLGRGDPGAGNVYYPLQFTNTGKSACVLNGFPGVSLIQRDGSVIGKPAARQGGAGKPVTIAPGKTVQSDLHTLNKGIKGNSCWKQPAYLMVYPPGSTESMTLATSSPLVCGDTFDVSAVH